MLATPPALLTAEAFARVAGPDQPTELVRGELRPMTATFWHHGLVAAEVFTILAGHVRAHRLGLCFGDNVGFGLDVPGADGDTVRSPDAAFVRAERLPAEGIANGWFPFAPDLAVAVLSASDTASILAEKLDDCLAAGTAAVWVIDPLRRAVEVHTADGRVQRLRDGDTLDGAPVLPDLRIPVADLFAGLARVDVR